MKPQVEVIELDEATLHANLNRIEAALGPEVAQPFRQLLAAYTTLMELLREKDISIQRLRKMLFGPSSERSCDILPPEDGSSEEEKEKEEGEQQQQEQEQQQQGDNEAPAEPGSDASQEDAEPPSSGATKHQDTPANDPGTGNGPKRRPGHGRNPASAYTGCKLVVVTHDSLHPGDTCPCCTEGTLYRQSKWSPVVRLKGQAPVSGTVYRRERLRCGLCGCMHTAELPSEAGPQKFDPTVASITATLRYGEGFPWNRLERVQKFAGVPLPASTQWEIVRDAATGGIQAAYDHLFKMGAQGEIVHNDDTSMRVLELTEKLKKGQPLLEEDPERRGVYTTNILSRAEGRPPIALFFTGPHHSGENLRELLGQRLQELSPPIQMCDALSRNMPEDLRVILANCLAHGRRKFVEVVDAFPSEVKYVIHCFKQVYKTDAEARQQQLLPTQRLQLHQQQSQPVMDELQRWLKEQFDERKVEPNSSLGEAISYMLKHWEKLTLFLRVAGAPLDNNICERALKMSIRHRRNSLFYKTMRGAKVGDLYMSLIHTCYWCGADPFDYLTELQRNEDRVIAAPGDWMPWNYRQQLGTDQTDMDSSRAPPGDSGISTTQEPGC